MSGASLDKDWANKQLRAFVRVLKADPFCSLDPGHVKAQSKQICEDLRSAGFPWQAERVENHLHLWLKNCRGRRPRERMAPLERVRRGEVGRS